MLVALLVALKIIPETVPWDSYGLKEDVATSLQVCGGTATLNTSPVSTPFNRTSSSVWRCWDLQ